MEQLQSNFSVAGPASLTLSSLTDDPVAVARQMYRHYTGTTHVTMTHAEDLNRVSNYRPTHTEESKVKMFLTVTLKLFIRL